MFVKFILGGNTITEREFLHVPSIGDEVQTMEGVACRVEGVRWPIAGDEVEVYLIEKANFEPAQPAGKGE